MLDDMLDIMLNTMLDTKTYATLLTKFGRKSEKTVILNVHKTFRRRPGRLLNVLNTFNLHPVSRRNELFSEKVTVIILEKFCRKQL